MRISRSILSGTVTGNNTAYSNCFGTFLRCSWLVSKISELCHRFTIFDKNRPDAPYKIIIIIISAAFVTGRIVYTLFFHKKTTDMDRLIRQERQKESAAKYGDKDPQIEVIIDPVKVQQLREQVLQRIKHAHETPEPLDLIPDLARRYRQHDAAATSAILAIMKRQHSQRRKDMMDRWISAIGTQKFIPSGNPRLLQQS